MFLDDILQQQYEHSEASLKERDNRTNADKQLQEEGETIRTAAVRWLREQASSEFHASTDIPDAVEADTTNNTPAAPSSQLMRTAERPATSDEEDKWFIQEMEQKSQHDAKRIRLDEERLNIRREQA